MGRDQGTASCLIHQTIKKKKRKKKKNERKEFGKRNQGGEISGSKGLSDPP